MENQRVTLIALALLGSVVVGYGAVLLTSPAAAVLIIVVASWLNLAVLVRLTR